MLTAIEFIVSAIGNKRTLRNPESDVFYSLSILNKPLFVVPVQNGRLDSFVIFLGKLSHLFTDF